MQVPQMKRLINVDQPINKDRYAKALSLFKALKDASDIKWSTTLNRDKGGLTIERSNHKEVFKSKLDPYISYQTVIGVINKDNVEEKYWVEMRRVPDYQLNETGTISKESFVMDYLFIPFSKRPDEALDYYLADGIRIYTLIPEERRGWFDKKDSVKRHEDFENLLSLIFHEMVVNNNVDYDWFNHHHDPYLSKNKFEYKVVGSTKAFTLSERYMEEAVDLKYPDNHDQRFSFKIDFISEYPFTLFEVPRTAFKIFDGLVTNRSATSHPDYMFKPVMDIDIEILKDLYRLTNSNFANEGYIDDKGDIVLKFKYGNDKFIISDKLHSNFYSVEYVKTVEGKEVRKLIGYILPEVTKGYALSGDNMYLSDLNRPESVVVDADYISTLSQYMVYGQKFRDKVEDYIKYNLEHLCSDVLTGCLKIKASGIRYKLCAEDIHVTDLSPNERDYWKHEFTGFVENLNGVLLNSSLSKSEFYLDNGVSIVKNYRNDNDEYLVNLGSNRFDVRVSANKDGNSLFITCVNKEQLPYIRDLELFAKFKFDFLTEENTGWFFDDHIKKNPYWFIKAIHDVIALFCKFNGAQRHSCHNNSRS